MDETSRSSPQNVAVSDGSGHACGAAGRTASDFDRRQQVTGGRDAGHLCSHGTTPNAVVVGAFSVASAALLLGVVAVTYQIAMGIGTWGLNRTVGWAFDITNFVFWVGIGHAGTLISAVLFLFRQKWRTSVNRSAEAMTLFAVICAGTFPLIHMGRPWLAFWTLPYPNARGSLWVNFKSPLLWDVFAISTYLLISAVFWYVGLIPDLATIRDRSQPGWRKWITGVLSLGWNGSARTWHRYETVYMLLAGLATPLVFSVHTIVSMDFATAVIPGWHTTVFPPYFVAGAIFSGLAMVLTLMIIARKVMQLEDYVTVLHVEMMCKLMLSMGCIVGLAYATEFFMAAYSGNPYEQFVFINRAFGPFSWAYWTMVTCNVGIPQLLWFRQIRRHIAIVFVISIFVNIGHVVRAVRDYRDQSAPRLPSLQLGQLRSDVDRDCHVDRQFRAVLHVFSRVLPLRAGNRHGRSEGRTAK